MIRTGTVIALVTTALLLSACADYASGNTSGDPASGLELLNLGAALLSRPAPMTTNCVGMGAMVSCRSF
jgi:hypothetical protein